MIRLYKEYAIGVKKLSEADLGWETSSSSQTHIGLSEQVFKFLSNTLEQRDGIMIYNRSCSFVECAFSKIGKKRSTKIDSTTSNPVKSVVKQIRNIASNKDKEWVLVWFALENQIPVFWLVNDNSDDYSLIKEITGLNFQMKVFNSSKDEYFKLLSIIRTISKLDNIVSQKYTNDDDNILIAVSDEHRTFVHLTLDYFRAKGQLDILSDYFNTKENNMPIKLFKEGRFNLLNMFMYATIEELDKRNSTDNGRRWYSDAFPIKGRDCYLYVDWYPGKNKNGNDEQLMIPDFINLVHDCYGSKYVYRNSQGTHELWLVNKPESFFVDSDKGNMEIKSDVSKFKHLLEYFCSHLQYIVTEDKSVPGYNEYLKKYIDSGTFRKSGQGYKPGQKIQQQITAWEQYNAGVVCIAVYGTSFKSYSTYLHWKGTGHNISANWDGDTISSLQLVEFKGNSKWEEQPVKFSLDELGLYDDNEPNENVRIMFDAFVDMLKKSDEIVDVDSITQIPFSLSAIIDSIKNTGLLYDDKLIQRYACSLMTKPFVILSGLAGSGKTQLALAFARTISENVDQQLCVVPVGADWTNREPLLGYPNALKHGEYMQPESGALQIMMRALRNPNKPYFLVLDEMNLSYVERYFADFLSAPESHEEIPLWEKPDECDSEVPAKIALPKNLFIVGTINVDETTYMFSPKVLDRANVIEFKISESEMDIFLKQDMNIDIHAADGLCANMGQDFVEKSTKKDTESSELAQKTLIEFFKVLKRVNAEFGYRSATEIYRFIANAKTSAPNLTEDEILDAAIVQKLLPKLHGSRKKLEPALKALWGLSMQNEHTTEAITRDNLVYAKFPEAADKIQRMMQTALDNGFTSFAEA